MREVLLLEAPDGFIVQGLVTSGGSGGTWSESLGQEAKETLTFIDDDIARFMEEALARRGAAQVAGSGEGRYEQAFRVLGRWLDEQRPHDVFFFEQSGAFVVRTLMASQAGKQHVLSAFTKEDIEALVAQGPLLRNKERKAQAAQAETPAAPVSPAAPPR